MRFVIVNSIVILELLHNCRPLFKLGGGRGIFSGICLGVHKLTTAKTMYKSTDHYSVAIPAPSRPYFEVETLLEKGSSAQNEDVLLSADNIFGVFDGATSLEKRIFEDGLTGGLLAAKTAAGAFTVNQGSLYDMAKTANENIRNRQLNHDILPQKRHTLWSTSMAVIRLSETSFEYCQTGDALILAINEDGSHKMLTPDIDIDRQTLQLWKELELSPDAKIHDSLAKQIKLVRQQMNVSYGVLNGEPEALPFIHHGVASLEGIRDILIFTDGLFVPRENPMAPSDWDSFVQLYLEGGLSLLRDHVRQIQINDPECRQFPRFKLHDDIAAIAINFG